jgi:hypothetical protein
MEFAEISSFILSQKKSQEIRGIERRSFGENALMVVLSEYREAV